jgi:chromosome segregation ATPase
MVGKDLLLELEDQNALLKQHVAEREHEISGLREQLRRRELALEAFVSPLKQTPLPERGSAAGSGRLQELSSRIHALENELRALKREKKALQGIDVRKSKALDELDRTIQSLEEERDVQRLAHAQEMAMLKARVGETHDLARRYYELERAHAALAEECAALQATDNVRVKDWMAERRRLKEEVWAAHLHWLSARTLLSKPTGSIRVVRTSACARAVLHIAPRDPMSDPLSGTS